MNLLESPPPPFVSDFYRMAEYSGPMGSLIRRGKYRPDLLLFQSLSKCLGNASRSLKSPDVVSFVPAATCRIRNRGFDQSRLLARKVAENHRVPMISLLNRVDPGEQAGRTLQQRRNPEKSRFSLRRSPPAHVLLVDDVRTTGGTISECASILIAGGSVEISALVLASA